MKIYSASKLHDTILCPLYTGYRSIFIPSHDQPGDFSKFEKYVNDTGATLLGSFSAFAEKEKEKENEYLDIMRVYTITHDNYIKASKDRPILRERIKYMAVPFDMLTGVIYIVKNIARGGSAVIPIEFINILYDLLHILGQMFKNVKIIGKYLLLEKFLYNRETQKIISRLVPFLEYLAAAPIDCLLRPILHNPDIKKINSVLASNF